MIILDNLTLAVVIPCFNSARTLDRALNSVLNQSRVPDEIIVVDDCSDNPEEIERIVSFYDGINLIRNKKNIGLAGSRNIGIWEAKCEIVTFLDSDDKCHPNRFEEQLKYIANNTVVTCDVANSGNIKELCDLSSVHIQEYSSPIRNMFFPSLTGAALMAEVGLLKKYGGYDSQLRACEDYDLWLRLLVAGVKVLRVEAPLYYYFDSYNSLSKNAMLIAKSTLISVDKYFNKNKYKSSVVLNWCILFLILSKIYINLYIQGMERGKIKELFNHQSTSINPILLRIVFLFSIIGFYRLSAFLITKFIKK